jgi:nicotinamidase-related amidase
MSTRPLLLLATAFALLVALAAFTLVRRMFLHTRGRRIGRYARPRKALLVLDLQEGYVSAPGRELVTARPATRLTETVNRLIDHAEKAGWEVAYVRQVFGSSLLLRLHGGRRQGKVIVDRRIRVINANDFEKDRTDAFSSRPLERLLIDREVDELFLVGVDAAYCVFTTALGARSRGYRVSVVADAVASRHPLGGVLERYRRRGIGVVESGELLRAPAPPARAT